MSFNVQFSLSCSCQQIWKFTQNYRKSRLRNHAQIVDLAERIPETKRELCTTKSDRLGEKTRLRLHLVKRPARCAWSLMDCSRRKITMGKMGSNTYIRFCHRIDWFLVFWSFLILPMVLFGNRKKGWPPDLGGRGGASKGNLIAFTFAVSDSPV